LAAFDVIGWNMRGNLSSDGRYNYTTANAYNSFIAGVPEPSVWMQLILGFGVIGGAVRYRRRRAVLGFA
ncbi:MAG: PEP-CTERM sorting domain-containing protein, partial [Sphingomonadales bacterium]